MTATRGVAGVAGGPRYRDLPRDVDGVRTATGVFGEHDSVGMVNRLTPEHVVEASRLVRRGVAFPLDAPVGFFDPPLHQRGGVRHTVMVNRPLEAFDDVYDNLNPQAGSQWDALGHVAAGPDRFYNGATAAEVADGRRNTIDHWARRGIVGRAVVLDVEGIVRERGGHGNRLALSVGDLERARSAARLDYRAGDIVLLHTGFPGWYAQLDFAQRRRLSQRDALLAVGLEQSEPMVEYLWDSGIAALATDTPGVEAWPPDRSGTHPYGFLHQTLIGRIGLALGELWKLDALVADSREQDHWEAMLVSVPVNAAGVSSSANAVALR